MAGTGRMSNLLNETKKKTDAAFSAEEARVIMKTTVDLESLRPRITDKDAFDQVLAVVNEATAKNYSNAELQAKISVLGENAQKIFKDVISIIT